MSSLNNKSPKNSYKELLKIDSASPNGGLDSVLRNVEDGDGKVSPLQLATGKIALQGKEWPTTDGAVGTILQVSSDSTKLEWVPMPNAMQVTTSFFPGAIAAMTGTVRWYSGRAVTLKSVFMSISSAPTQNVSIDVKKNGLTIFSGNAPTIIAGQNTSAIVPLDIAMTSADYLTVDILAGNGSDMSVRIEYI